MPIRTQKSKRQKSRFRRVNNFEKLHRVFKELPESVQFVLVLGIILLLAWIVSHPVVLQGIIRAFQLWFTAKGALRWLQS